MTKNMITRLKKKGVKIWEARILYADIHTALDELCDFFNFNDFIMLDIDVTERDGLTAFGDVRLDYRYDVHIYYTDEKNYNKIREVK